MLGFASRYVPDRDGVASSHPTMTSAMFDVVQFKEGYQGSDDIDFIHKAIKAHFADPGEGYSLGSSDGFGLFLYVNP